MLNERRRLVLQALVEEYIHSGQPVGSRSLVERHHIDCSPATVRSELAALEETGYVFQPHISSGRIPTDLGYREFVDEIMNTVGALPELDAEEMDRRYREVAGEIDDLMRQTSSMLAHLTHYVAVVLAPTVSLSRTRRLDLVSMGPRRALVVLITETGQVVNRHVELAEDVTPERLADVERALNSSLEGKRASEVRPLEDALDSERPGDGVVKQVMGELISCLEEADRDRLYHVGTPELLALPEFAEAARIAPLLNLLEDGLAMLDTLSGTLSAGGLTVRIGSENERDELGAMSLVATRYGTTSADGVVGVIGPTRMDYQRTIAAVRAAANGLSDALG